MSELYHEDLNTLITVLACLEDLSKVEGLFEVEIRVRVDVDTWAVVGYGDSGEPCVLRFESPPKQATAPWPSLPNTTYPGAMVTYKNDAY